MRIAYKRLPGRVMGFVHTPSAWLADDHILVITGTRVHETYKRVYLTDVKALIIRKKRRFIFHWPYLFAMPALIAVAASNSNALWVGAVIAFLFIAILLAIGMMMQYGCYLDIATAVGNVTVKSVPYTWTAKRFIAKAGPAIYAAQQSMVPPTEVIPE